MITHAPWTAIDGLRHGFLDRHAKEPEGRWVVSGIPVATPRQVHGTRVVTAPGDEPRPEADGLIATTAGTLVGVVTADCVPVLLVDPRRRVAAAVHAGWRGASAGVLEEAVRRLADSGSAPGDLEAAIGPAVGGCCYEVGPEVVEAFKTRSGDVTAPAWEPRPGRWHVDLRTAVRLLLVAAGVRAATVLGPCTACDPRYHSFRRNARAAGRQLSFVGWT